MSAVAASPADWASPVRTIESLTCLAKMRVRQRRAAACRVRRDRDRRSSRGLRPERPGVDGEDRRLSRGEAHHIELAGRAHDGVGDLGIAHDDFAGSAGRSTMIVRPTPSVIRLLENIAAMLSTPTRCAWRRRADGVEASEDRNRMIANLAPKPLIPILSSIRGFASCVLTRKGHLALAVEETP